MICFICKIAMRWREDAHLWECPRCIRRKLRGE
jgi:predicted RNA-binding Zn-ribbon protein involved in translation (DUF1610 family)